MKVTKIESYQEMRVMRDGPAKKFALIKGYARALRQRGVANPDLLSCAELIAHIDTSLKDT